MNSITCILLSGILGVIGQLILKQAVVALGPLALRPETALTVVSMLAFDPLVLIGLAITVSGTFFWLVSISRVDLSFAYPFASLNYVMILAAAWWIFGEQPTLTHIVGVVLICFGVGAISRTPATTSSGRVGSARTSAPSTGEGTKR